MSTIRLCLLTVNFWWPVKEKLFFLVRETFKLKQKFSWVRLGLNHSLAGCYRVRFIYKSWHMFLNEVYAFHLGQTLSSVYKFFCDPEFLFSGPKCVHHRGDLLWTSLTNLFQKLSIVQCLFTNLMRSLRYILDDYLVVNLVLCIFISGQIYGIKF